MLKSQWLTEWIDWYHKEHQNADEKLSKTYQKDSLEVQKFEKGMSVACPELIEAMQ